jgi:hypothetical protein
MMSWLIVLSSLIWRYGGLHREKFEVVIGNRLRVRRDQDAVLLRRRRKIVYSRLVRASLVKKPCIHIHLIGWACRILPWFEPAKRYQDP